MKKPVVIIPAIIAMAALFLIQDFGAYEPEIVPEQATQTIQQPASPLESTQASCDESYPDVCIPAYPPDLDCGEIGFSNFRVTGADPHRFDGDNDGIGCES